MAPRENGGNDGDGPKPERSLATLSTLRYGHHSCYHVQICILLMYRLDKG
jgi:hypothetical protein